MFASEPAMNDTNSITVLVVEDEYFIAREIALALEDIGARVLGPVGNVKQAEDMLARARPDCALLDINLHGDMIFPVADELVTRGIKFVFATGYDALVVPDRFQDVPRWEKPFDVTDLANSLTALVGPGADR